MVSSSEQRERSSSTWNVPANRRIHGSDGKSYKWEIAHPYANDEESGTAAHVTNSRPDTRGQKWNPLALSSQ